MKIFTRILIFHFLITSKCIIKPIITIHRDVKENIDMSENQHKKMHQIFPFLLSFNLKCFIFILKGLNNSLKFIIFLRCFIKNI